MTLIPGQNRNDIGGAPPNQTGHLWFLRACVGLSFTLWSAAMSQPLAKFGLGWGTMLSGQVYPLGTGSLPNEPGYIMFVSSLFVDGTFVAIVMTGLAVGTLASHDKGTRLLGEGLKFLAGGWCVIGGMGIYVFVIHSTKGYPMASPLTGMWLVWMATAVLLIPVGTDFDKVNPIPAPPQNSAGTSA